ncbi:MAG: hypothetical protein ACTSRP_02345 [Candidatus Helarchaeota archaeon]
MTEESLILTSSIINEMSLVEFFNKLSSFEWENLTIDIYAMPRKDLKKPPHLHIEKFPDSINNAIKSFETPIESIVISGSINKCRIKMTGLVEKNQVRWLEANFKAEKKSIVEKLLKEFTDFLKKKIDI